MYDSTKFFQLKYEPLVNKARIILKIEEIDNKIYVCIHVNVQNQFPITNMKTTL